MLKKRREKGQTTIEYALLIAFVVALITAIGYFIKTRVLA
jgi:Flp pilus assembly pilin Flp